MQLLTESSFLYAYALCRVARMLSFVMDSPSGPQNSLAVSLIVCAAIFVSEFRAARQACHFLILYYTNTSACQEC